jgi:hypothetical protein
VPPYVAHMPTHVCRSYCTLPPSPFEYKAQVLRLKQHILLSASASRVLIHWDLFGSEKKEAHAEGTVFSHHSCATHTWLRREGNHV